MGAGVTVWGEETGMEASKTMWRVVTVFIGPKPKGGREGASGADRLG